MVKQVLRRLSSSDLRAVALPICLFCITGSFRWRKSWGTSSGFCCGAAAAAAKNKKILRGHIEKSSLQGIIALDEDFVSNRNREIKSWKIVLKNAPLICILPSAGVRLWGSTGANGRKIDC